MLKSQQSNPITVPEHYYALTPHLDEFTAWLKSTGHSIGIVTSVWEVLRYFSSAGLPNSFGTIHRNKRNRLTFNDRARQDWLEWQGLSPKNPSPTQHAQFSELSEVCALLAAGKATPADYTIARELARKAFSFIA
jgi:hypothetical protein